MALGCVRICNSCIGCWDNLHDSIVHHVFRRAADHSESGDSDWQLELFATFGVTFPSGWLHRWLATCRFAICDVSYNQTRQLQSIFLVSNVKHGRLGKSTTRS